jgi:hypothetical protein
VKMLIAVVACSEYTTPPWNYCTAVPQPYLQPALSSCYTVASSRFSQPDQQHPVSTIKGASCDPYRAQSSTKTARSGGSCCLHGRVRMSKGASSDISCFRSRAKSRYGTALPRRFLSFVSPSQPSSAARVRLPANSPERHATAYALYDTQSQAKGE